MECDRFVIAWSSREREHDCGNIRIPQLRGSPMSSTTGERVGRSTMTCCPG